MASKYAAKHGYAAFAREDVEDARRRRPPGSLEPYAQGRGLGFRDRGGLAGFRGALPSHPEYVHNLMRGTLPGGRFGILYHELLQTHGEGSGMQGTFHSVKTSSPGWLRATFALNRTDIPILGNILDAPTAKGELEAFESPGAWSPCTTAAIMVPESVAAVGTLRLTVKSRTPFLNSRTNLDLEPYGLPGWRAVVPDTLDDAGLTRVLAGGVAAALAPLTDAPFAMARIALGTVVVRRNGYLMEPAALDAFAATACAVADALVAFAGPAPSVAFSAPLPAWPLADTPDNVVGAGLPLAWIKDFRAFAQRHGLVPEDPAAWHRSFPALPVPGQAFAVLRAGSGQRLLFVSEAPLSVTRAVRAALVLPVAAGTPDTPPGGIAQPERRTIVAVQHGLAAVWSMDWFGHAGDADGFTQQALAALEAAGIVPA